MKKTFLFVAALLATVAMNAQHVTPLGSLSADFQLDTMRVLYANNAVGMVEELNIINTAMEADSKMLKDAEKQLKQEGDYAKELAKYAKAAQSAIKNMEKTYNSELKALQAIQKSLDDMQSALPKLNMVVDEHKSMMDHDVRIQSKQVAQSISDINNLLRHIVAQNQYTEKLQNNLSVYNEEIKNKGAQLKVLQERQKANKEAVKKEMTAAKAAVKAQK